MYYTLHLITIENFNNYPLTKHHLTTNVNVHMKPKSNANININISSEIIFLILKQILYYIF